MTWEVLIVREDMRQAARTAEALQELMCEDVEVREVKI